MSEHSKHRMATREALKLISSLSVAHNIEISGYMRDKMNGTIVGVLITFVQPIKESDLERGAP